MKLFFILISVFIPSSLYAAGEEVEQTKSFVEIFLGFFSTQMLINIGLACGVIIFTIILSKFIQARLFGYLENSNIWDDGSKEELIWVISRTVNIFVLIAGFSITLGILGLDLGIFMWGIGFGIGFTLRTFLTNFISGIIVVSQGSYHIGDLIEVRESRWRITKINALFTEVEQLDGVIFNIPNVRFIEENVRNFHTNDKRRIDVDVVVDYATDITQAKKVLEKVLSNFPNILQAPSSDILIESLWERGVNLKLRFWIHSKENFITLKSNITETVNLAFKQMNINIPYPHVTLVEWSDTHHTISQTTSSSTETTPVQRYKASSPKNA